MKTIVAGSRTILDYEHIKNACEWCGWKITEVVSGKAKGVDRLGEDWANANGIPIKPFPAKWRDIEGKPPREIKTNKWGKYWKKAGIVRNLEMAQYADALVAVWDGQSTGTKSMIDLARQHKLKVYVLEIPSYQLLNNYNS